MAVLTSACLVGSVASGVWARPSDAVSTPAGLRSMTTVGQRTEMHREDALAVGVSSPESFDVLVPAADGGWTQLASLRVAGLETHRWVGEICVTGSGRYAAVAFAPITFANKPYLRDQGAFGATIDLRTGAHWLLPERVALKYHTPGCGASDAVVFTRAIGEEGAPTEILEVDPTTPAITARHRVNDQVVSVVPTRGGLLGVAGPNAIVRVVGGGLRQVTATSGRPFDLRPSADGGVDFVVASGGSKANAMHMSPRGELRELASGALGKIRIAAGFGGHNRVVGSAITAVDAEVVAVERLPVAVSLGGTTVVTRIQHGQLAANGESGAPIIHVRDVASGSSRSSSLSSSLPSLPHAAASNSTEAESPRAPFTTLPTTPSTTTVTTTPTAPPTPKSAVSPIDYKRQVLQPMPAQVEWAVHRAVRGELNFTRPANWQRNGTTAAYTPSSQFPPGALSGGGHVPAQVVLGVLATESNLNQATYGALPGVAGGVLVGDYYGVTHAANGHINGMNFNNADCGYGIGQITDHMTTADNFYSSNEKLQIATDYTANLAVAVQKLTSKWNELKAPSVNIVANSGNPDAIENWYFTLWSYNTGFYPNTGSGPWGVGWTNNPANIDYPPDRLPYLRYNYDDSITPSHWPYQEQVLGWAEVAQLKPGTTSPKYIPAAAQLNLPSDIFFACDASNDCSEDHNDGAKSYCKLPSRRCWWHKPVQWTSVGTPENTAAYVPGAAEPGTVNPQPPDCAPGASKVLAAYGSPNLPSTAVVVDELPSTAWNLVGCPGVAQQGTFTMVKNKDSGQNPTGDIDFHQLGTGYGGHFWYAHTLDPTRPNYKVTGTWKPPSSVVGWQRIYAHIPVTGADTFQAKYVITTGLGKTFERTVNQRWNVNGWYDLGSFALGNGSSVSLSNVTYADWGVKTKSPTHEDFATASYRAIDIAFDAVAFVPSTKPVVSYVAFGDSFSAGEGVEPYFADSDVGKSTPTYKNACHRSSQGYPYLVMADVLGQLDPALAQFHFAACSGATMRQLRGDSQPSATGADQQHHEVPQLKQGWLDENTTHVSLSIGGNDAGFADVLSGCMMTVRECTAPDFYLKRGETTDDEPLIVAEPKIIDGLKPDLVALINRIKTLAPNAKITLVGYPHVIATNEPLVLACSGWSTQTINWFAQMGDRLVGVLRDAATETGTRFADVRSRFAGHEACVYSAEWINAIVAFSSSGSGQNVPGSGSFHPKATGHQAGYRPAVYARVSVVASAPSPSWGPCASLAAKPRRTA